MAIRHGEWAGHYQVLQLIGRGSFGAVSLAVDPRRPRQRFALKIVPCDHLDAEAAARARQTALAEADLLRRLRHPNVVTCHDVCWDAERRVVWFALDYMDGGDVHSIINSRRHAREPPPDARFVRQVFNAIGSALRYIHSESVLHRDVKPSNMLLTLDMPTQIKLADFGISKILETTALASTVVGTPYYMAPEIVCGQPYGPASDAWALGVCLYELSSLERPFDAGNQLALARQIVEEMPAPLPRFPGLDPGVDLRQVIGGLLAKEPLRRLTLEAAVTAVGEAAAADAAAAAGFASQSDSPLVFQDIIGDGAVGEIGGMMIVEDAPSTRVSLGNLEELWLSTGPAQDITSQSVGGPTPPSPGELMPVSAQVSPRGAAGQTIERFGSILGMGSPTGSLAPSLLLTPRRVAAVEAPPTQAAGGASMACSPRKAAAPQAFEAPEEPERQRQWGPLSSLFGLGRHLQLRSSKPKGGADAKKETTIMSFTHEDMADDENDSTAGESPHGVRQTSPGCRSAKAACHAGGYGGVAVEEPSLNKPSALIAWL
eukprot:TRINITY_DN24823_c0_g1_i1.p1 TRINITY_DN24823_c0_g1~~TRINITY_DN24823_c0_g1_i1.p1  ORF type:complete len:544 (+),score=110.75 TRINITY_DN24823_c0_g1_i1:106-1737(+)